VHARHRRYLEDGQPLERRRASSSLSSWPIGKLLFRAEAANLASYAYQHQHPSAGITALLFYPQTTPSRPNPQQCPFQHYSLPVMATLSPPSPSQSPTRMPRKWARKCERYCCLGATYFPLVFVYSITSWAVWVEATIGFLPAKTLWIGILSFPFPSSGPGTDLNRPRDLLSRNRPLPPPQLVLHDSRLYESWNYNEQSGVQLSSYTSGSRGHELHR
jgi:hypothetical protein